MRELSVAEQRYQAVMAVIGDGLSVSQAAEKMGVSLITDEKPVAEGVRLHDLRHRFAVLQLSAGVHFMQVSQWLGHATYSLTLDVYGGYIPQADGGVPNALPEPTAPTKAVQTASNVVPLFR
jgi:integrase